MFFVHEMEERIPLHPSYFSSEAPDSIRELLYKKKEGTNTGTMMIVRIIGIQEISEPKVMPGTGMAMYTISYRAVVWQPFRGEVVDGEVSQVVPNGFFVDVGALGVFISKAVSGDGILHLLGMVFQHWVWGLTGVLCPQMIPSSLKYSMEGATPSFADNEGQVVEAGSQVRLRIKGIRSELNQMFAIGSIREDYLGYELAHLEQVTSITDRRLLVLFCSSRVSQLRTPTHFSFCRLTRARRRFFFMLVTAVYHNLDFSEALETRASKAKRAEQNKGEESYVYVFMSTIKIPNRNRILFVQSCQSLLYQLRSLVNRSIIVPLQILLAGLPMLPKRLINPHDPPKKIPTLIQLVQKRPEPSQNQIGITRLFPKHIRSLRIFAQNLHQILQASLSLLPSLFPSLLALRQIRKLNAIKPRLPRPAEILLALRVQQHLRHTRDRDR